MHPQPDTRRRCRLVAALAAAALTTTVAGAATSYAGTGDSYLSVLNQERASRGIAPLHVSADLERVAQSWAAEMARTAVLQHNPRLTSEVSNWQSVGENVGRGASLRDLADAFWASSSHRRNILDPDFTQVGIGAVIADHRMYIAVEFRQPMHATGTTAQSRGSSRTTERAYPGRLLMRGTSGPAVAYVQRLLGVAVSGFFGAQTQQAVLRFQRLHHLAVDGIVGPITWSALVRART